MKRKIIIISILISLFSLWVVAQPKHMDVPVSAFSMQGSEIFCDARLLKKADFLSFDKLVFVFKEGMVLEYQVFLKSSGWKSRYSRVLRTRGQKIVFSLKQRTWDVNEWDKSNRTLWGLGLKTFNKDSSYVLKNLSRVYFLKGKTETPVIDPGTKEKQMKARIMSLKKKQILLEKRIGKLERQHKKLYKKLKKLKNIER